MRLIVIILLALAAHLAATAFVPTTAGKAWFGWPFAADSRPWLGFIGGLPSQHGSTVTPLIAGIAVLGFVGAAFAVMGWWVPANWFTPLVIASAIASIALFVLYVSEWSLVPLALDAVLLWGVLLQNWSVTSLRGV